MAKSTQSIEPNIADLANGWMKGYKLDYKLEQESLNTEIDKALADYFTKMVVQVLIAPMQSFSYKIKILITSLF